MLACYPRRHNNNHFNPPSHLPSPTTSLSHLDFNPNNFAYTPSSVDAIDTSSPAYLDQFSAFANSSFDSQQQISSQYMSNTFGNANQSPAIRLQQSTPLTDSSATFNYNQGGWSAYPESNAQMAAKQSLQTQFLNRRSQAHRRAPSSSSVASSGPASPFSQGHASSLPYNISAENSPSTKVESAFEENSRSYSNHLPTPTQTPTQDAFLSPTYPNPYTNQNPSYQAALEAHLAMNQAMDSSNNVDDDMPGISHSSRHSVSSYGQDPATPHDVYDDMKGFNTTDVLRQTVPKFERTMTDAFADTGYDPTSIPTLSTSNISQHQTPSAFLSPSYRTVTERLQQAQQARSQSPVSAAAGRGVSPFRNGSPLAPTSANSFSRVKAETAKEARDRQSMQANAMALRRNTEQQDEAPKTISPKDVELEYQESEEDSKMPLFPDGSSEDFNQSYTAGTDGYRSNGQVKYDNSNVNYGSVATSRNDNWNANPQQSYSTATAAPQSNFTFQAPSMPASMQSLPFSSQKYRTTSNMAPLQDESPEFPAHLTSMESSASEAPPSSNNSTNTAEVQKPTSALADSGTYTCTYHGCTQRFETPQKLQRHKREAHRQTAPTTPSAIGSSMTSAALLARNSQAGPHKCERINPTTGKPCNTIFSRPYDLTRHEDTIHNIRKQKVRCALCVEDKTFSRNDALTRHMRVVHPEVDFPGKHRRRGS